MNGRPGHVNVLGLDVAFREDADLERIQNAASFLETRYAQRKKGMHGLQGKDNLLILLALELADELLQLKHTRSDMQKRILDLLEKIEKSS